jgi:hypothetical protein
MTTEKGERIMVVKNWHITLFVLVWFGTIIWSYATLTAQANETERRVEDLEKHRLTTEQFNEFRADLFRQLDSWEKQVELDRSLHQLSPTHKTE